MKGIKRSRMATSCALVVLFVLQAVHATNSAEGALACERQEDCGSSLERHTDSQPAAPTRKYLSENGEYTTELFAHRARRTATDQMMNITVVTHITLDRSPKLLALCDHWRGPISLSIYLRRHLQETPQLALSGLKVNESGCVAEHVDIHFVRLTNPKGTSTFQRVDMHTYYPFNVQRNAALRGAAGRWLLLLDIDMLIHPRSTYGRERLFSKNFHTVRTAPSNRKIFYPGISADEDVANLPPSRHNEFVTVIPAIETVNKKVPIPQTFKDLQYQFSEHQATAFYGHYCRDCHGSTNVQYYLAMMLHHTNLSTRKEQQDGGGGGGDGAGGLRVAPYLVRYVPDYEPYVIVYRDDRLPLYDERFVGRGYDKMSYFFELDAQGRRFVVLAPGPYLAHHGRGDEPTTEATEEYKALQKKTKRMWAEFKDDIAVKYGRKPATAVKKPPSPPDSEAPPPSPAPEAVAAPDVPPAEPDARWPVRMASCIDDGEPCCLASCQNTSDCDSMAEKLVAALSYACANIDCSPLHSFRSKPAAVMHHADWAFNSYFRSFRRREDNTESDESLCNFSGLAALYAPEQQQDVGSSVVEGDQKRHLPGSTDPPPLPRCARCLLHQNATEDEIAAAVDWVCAPDQLGDCEYIFSMAENVLGSTAPQKVNNSSSEEGDAILATLRHRAEVLFTTYLSLFWPRIGAEDIGSDPSGGGGGGSKRLVPQYGREIGCSFGGIGYPSDC